MTKQNLPKTADFYWVKRAGETRMELAYWNGREFVIPESVGDYEGLSVETLRDVTHWSDLVAPAWQKANEIVINDEGDSDDSA